MLRPLSLVLGLACCLGGSTAYANIVVAVTYRIDEFETSPRQETVTGTHTIYFNMDGHSVTMQSDVNAQTSGGIGQSMVANKTDGSTYVFSSQIKGGHLIFKETYSTEVITTKVSTDGTGSCHAERSATLLPGQVYKRFDHGRGQMLFFSGIRYAVLSCSIND